MSARVRRRPRLLRCMMAVMQKTHKMNQVVACVNPDNAVESESTAPKSTSKTMPTRPTTPWGMVPQNHMAMHAKSTPSATTPSCESASEPSMHIDATTKTTARTAPMVLFTGNGEVCGTCPVDAACPFPSDGSESFSIAIRVLLYTDFRVLACEDRPQANAAAQHVSRTCHAAACIYEDIVNRYKRAACCISLRGKSEKETRKTDAFSVFKGCVRFI